MWESELKAALYAGELGKIEILKIYHEGFDVEFKEDKSPVTNADKASDEIIKSYLQKAFPSYAFLTEESFDDQSRLNNDYVWIIDPLDGTEDFVKKSGHFAINIALSYKHEIVVGVVVFPLLNEVYYASKGTGSYFIKDNLKPIRIHVNNKVEDLTCLISVFHFTEEEKKLIDKHSDKIKHIRRFGASLKPCLIARGLAEISYRTSPLTKEWDTAAPNIVVKEAGGLFLEPDGNELTYNRKDVYNRKGYIIVNRKENILL